MISSVAIEIYNSLNDKRNCISKYTRIKKAVPKEFVQILQGEIISADPNSNKGHLLKLNNDLYLYDKKETIILPFQSDLKFIHKILQKIKPIYQIKWGALYGEDINKGISLSKIKTGTCTK
jgi:fructose-1,6-bisphosphatase